MQSNPTTIRGAWNDTSDAVTLIDSAACGRICHPTHATAFSGKNAQAFYRL